MSLSTNEPLLGLRRQVALRHYRLGWSGLLFFLTLGACLETLHGFKIALYLDPDQHLRRELWTLAHAHGTLLALVQVAFAVGLPYLGRWSEASLKLASFLLADALVLIPLGFFLGGVGYSEADPSLGVLLVPLGFLLLFIGVALILRSAWTGGGMPALGEEKRDDKTHVIPAPEEG